MTVTYALFVWLLGGLVILYMFSWAEILESVLQRSRVGNGAIIDCLEPFGK